MPAQVIKSIFAKLFPKLNRRLTRTVTIPMTQSLVPSRMEEVPPGAKPVTYISFDAIVGRNSTFHLLTSDQLDEIGGVEYRALNALLWIVGCVRLLMSNHLILIDKACISITSGFNYFA